MDIKNQLNEQQYLAASCEKQYVRIIAGAGTGKTRTLTYRIAYLISKGVPSKKIVAITFTNKAAKEMLSRIHDLLEKENLGFLGQPLISTFHGFCFRFLKKEITAYPGYNKEFNIADESDQNQIYKDIFKNMVKGSSKDFVKSVTSKISSLKTEGCFVEDVSPDDVPLGSLYTFDELVSVYTKYQEYLRTQNLLDFDDLLMITYAIMKNNPDIRLHWKNKYNMFFIDEFQDTNKLQYDLVKLFMRDDSYLTVVGDPDQTIYTWRGAQNNIIKNDLLKDFPTLETVVLDKNYRSTQRILDAANSLIKNNRDRLEKNLVAANDVTGDYVYYQFVKDMDVEGHKVASIIAQLHEHENVKYSDIAVIYRSNYLSGEIEKQLMIQGIPYDVYGGLKFFERAEIKDALSYLRLAVCQDDLSLKRILKAPSKGIGEVAMQRAEELKNSLGEDVSLFQIFRNYQEELKLLNRSKLALKRFYDAYDKFLIDLANSDFSSDIVTAVDLYFKNTGFIDYVHELDKKDEEKNSYTASSSTSKVDNVSELMRSLQNFLDKSELDEDGNPTQPTLSDFLMNVALQSDQDTMEENADKVSLMTGHVSKGLEFPYVFVVGLTQGIFPTAHALMDGKKGAIEEERRLLYVCVTRAIKKLYLLAFGGVNFITGGRNEESMFIKELNIKVNNENTRTFTPDEYAAYKGVHKPIERSVTNNYQQTKNTAPIIHKPLGTLSRNTQDHYEVGDHIVHVSFGRGEVVEVLNNKIRVKFSDDVGEKVLAIGFKAYKKVVEE